MKMMLSDYWGAQADYLRAKLDMCSKLDDIFVGFAASTQAHIKDNHRRFDLKGMISNILI